MINYDKTNTLAYSFKKLIDELLSDNNNNQNYVSPYEFKEKLSKMNKLFKGVAANIPKSKSPLSSDWLERLTVECFR